MREAKRLQAEANAKYAEAEAVLSRFGLADVPPQPTPPQKGAEALNRRVRAMSAYQSNVKVEPPCVARSARTPGSIVSNSTTFGMRGVAQHPLVGAPRPSLQDGFPPYQEGNHVFGNEQPKVARDMLVQGAAPGPLKLCSDITRRQPVISELITIGTRGIERQRFDDDNLKKK